MQGKKDKQKTLEPLIYKASNVFARFKSHFFRHVRERIRTPDTLVRSQVLYPAELHTLTTKMYYSFQPCFCQVNAAWRNQKAAPPSRPNNHTIYQPPNVGASGSRPRPSKITPSFVHTMPSELTPHLTPSPSV